MAGRLYSRRPGAAASARLPIRRTLPMNLRRCGILLVELDSRPRFTFAGLLAGGNGIDSAPRWLGRAPHLDEPVVLQLDDLALLQQLDPERWVARADLVADHGDDAIARLLAAGLLISDDDGHADARARDDAYRGVPWWPPAAIAHAHGRWTGNDVERRRAEGRVLPGAEMLARYGAPPGPTPALDPVAAEIALPAPGHGPLDATLSARRSCRNFDASATLPSTALSTLLWQSFGALGTLRMAPGVEVVKKHAPAGGGLHCVEAFLLAQRVEGLSPGLYHYRCHAHALALLQSLSSDAARALAHRFVSGQHWFRDAPLMLLLVARFDRLFWKYRGHAKAWRVAQLDAGHLSQTWQLGCAALGLGGFVTAALNERDIEQALSLRHGRDGVICAIGAGPRDTQTRTQELDGIVPSVAAARFARDLPAPADNGDDARPLTGNPQP